MACGYPKEITFLSLPSLSICDLMALKYKKKKKPTTKLITGIGLKKETDYQPKMRCKCSLGNSLSQGFVTRDLKNHFTVFSCALQWSPWVLQKFRFSQTDLLYLKLLNSPIRFAEIPLSHEAKHYYQDFCYYRKVS